MKLEELMAKKKKEGKEMDPMHAASKMSMLQALRDEMGGMMKDDLQPDAMKKVSVASNDEEGLKHGLDKAKELIGHEGEESAEHEASESPDFEAGEHEGEEESLMKNYQEDPSKENLDALMACLAEKKAEMEHSE